MNVVVSSRHMEVSPAIKQYAEDKAGKLNKFYDRIHEIEVTVDADKTAADPLHVSMMVHGEHKNQFAAKSNGTDAYKLIDACVKTLEPPIVGSSQKGQEPKAP